MSIVLAAIDGSPVDGAVLRAAQAVAEVLGASPAAVHVSEGGADERAAAVSAAAAGVPLHLERGEVTAALVRAAADPGVAALVVGARTTSGGRRPAGRTALALLVAVPIPVVVVPPRPGPERIRRVLVALEGTPEATAPVTRVLTGIADRDVDVVVAHVHDPEHVPAFEEYANHEVRAWTREFSARWCPDRAARTELWAGRPGQRLVEAVGETEADLLLLSWARSLAPGHAKVVRQVLADTSVPVMLVRAETPGNPAAAPGRTPDDRPVPAP